MASRRGGHGDEGDQPDQGEPADQGGQADPRGYQEETFADREDWDRYRADEGVLPGNAPLNSFLARIARGLAAKARQGRQMGQHIFNYFKAGDKDSTNISRDDFLEFKNLLELYLKEINSSIKVSSAENALAIEKCIGAHSKDMEHLLQQFEAMSGHVKEAVSMGARAEKTSSENAEKIIQLLTEISVTLREVPPSSTGSFADRFMRMSKYPFEAGQVYEQFRQYLEFLGGFLLLLGVLDPKDEQLKERFFEKFLPDTTPGIYEDICRQGRDLMYKDFASDLSFQMSMQCGDGFVLTSSAKRSPMDDNVHGCQLRLRQPQLSLDFKFDTTKHVSAIVSFPGVLGCDVNPVLKVCYPFRDSSFVSFYLSFTFPHIKDLLAIPD
uniref:Uncharacterized protein n=2 Tax=Aegilops tauschii subsp. strangulata TaxID=200361 RepID=A0A453A531_AEGTS